MGTTALLTFEEFERLPEYPGKQELLEGDLIELPPADLVQHTVSEGIFLDKAHPEMSYKLSNASYVIPKLYFRSGAREVWHVYPKTRDVVVHIAGNSRTEEESVRTPLVPGFTLNFPEILGV